MDEKCIEPPEENKELKKWREAQVKLLLLDLEMVIYDELTKQANILFEEGELHEKR